MLEYNLAGPFSSPNSCSACGDPHSNKFSFAVLVTSALVKGNKCYHQDLIIEHVEDL